jgi:GNAT superfamily N-acetyltransferase
MILNLGSLVDKSNIIVRPAYREEWEDAMALAWRTFMKFEAHDYTAEGVESFLDFISDNVLYRMFIMGVYQLFVACDKKRLIGMISLRNETHISLLFVDERYHKQGIGRRLMEYVGNYVKTEEGHRMLTVNAAPYAIGFYHRIGFVDTGRLQMSDGIYYTPMEMSIR